MAKRGMSDERRFRAHAALSTISQAAAHQKNPGLMRDVRAIAKQNAESVAPRPSTPRDPSMPRNGGKGKK